LAETPGASEDEPRPIEVRGLVTSFGDRVIHDHLDLAVNRGEILGLVGGSGSGKSVLLSTLIGLKPPDAGEIRIFGTDIYSGTSDEVQALKSRWGVLFQGNALFSNLTVRENVGAPLFEHTKLPVQMIDDLARVKIVLSGLPADAAELLPAELSGGMQKRAGVARALALDPELLMMDEPTSGLDPIMAAQIDQLVASLARTLGLTVLLITHDLDTLYSICDRVAVLADKKVAAIGPVSELRKSDHPWIKTYFAGPRGDAAARAAERRAALAAKTSPGPRP
jgi:phospholipid/cholesterol/gamma-HCH transport system ATP-binding protein